MSWLAEVAAAEEIGGLGMALGMRICHAVHCGGGIERVWNQGANSQTPESLLATDQRTVSGTGGFFNIWDCMP
jgi:hypothetical protein